MTSLVFINNRYDIDKQKEVFLMIKEMINGFFMALADSVPGVSGGTVAFILGFYDQFIGSIHHLAFGDLPKKKKALLYLMKLGLGWIIGMILAVIILSSLFESKIYVISSLFIGFIIGAIPLIIKEEKVSLKKQTLQKIIACLFGILIVVLITYFNGKIHKTSMNLNHFSIGLGIQLFFIGMVAISAMFLPGISGSTILLIFGAYIPVINAIKSVLSFNLGVLPCLIIFGFGILFGALSVVKVIQLCLEKYREQTIYFILGMMIGSLYAIVMGPTTLQVSQVALSFQTFHIIAFIVGIGLVLGLQFIKERRN